jgi:hypothetical protein
VTRARLYGFGYLCAAALLLGAAIVGAVAVVAATLLIEAVAIFIRERGPYRRNPRHWRIVGNYTEACSPSGEVLLVFGRARWLLRCRGVTLCGWGVPDFQRACADLSREMSAAGLGVPAAELWKLSGP